MRFRILVAIFLTLLVAFFAWPLPPELTTLTPPHTQILDRNGQILYELSQSETGAKSTLSLIEIPKEVIQALLATEDQRFASHPGVDVIAIVRAAWQNLSQRGIQSGASTITQQLVRNRLHPAHRGYAYKLLEAYYALRLEWKYSKQEILTQYLNTAYFGSQSYGLAAAAQSYFGKKPVELSLAESALLVGLLQSPSGYDPHVNPEKAFARQETVLRNMLEHGDITDAAYETAKNEKIKIVPARTKILAPHFVMWLLQNHDFGEAEQVKTTLDLSLQTGIEQIVKNELAKLAEKNVTNSAVVVLDNATGEILAMVGGVDYFDTEHAGAVNVAVSARQPGSALKPFTYALALSQGATAATTVADVEAKFATKEGTPYLPRNYDYRYHGLVRVREALANSYNIPAVKTLERVGVENLMNFLRASGIKTLTREPEFYGLALTLGSGEVRLLELTGSYAMLARNGQTLTPHGIVGEQIPPAKQILRSEIAWLITDILSDNTARLPEFGESSALSFSFPVAAKTGTTRNSRDNWVLGYTPSYTVGVWVGNNDNSPMRGTSGVTGAGPIFHAVMEAVAAQGPKENFAQPENIVEQEICVFSGLRPTTLCPQKLSEHFIRGTEPQEPDNIYQKLKIDTRNNLLAGESCPVEYVEEKVFTVFPPELRAWAAENGYPVAPTHYSPFCPANVAAKKALQITRPYAGDKFQIDPLIPLASQKIVLEAQAENLATLEWYLDDKKIGEGSAPSFRVGFEPRIGTHTITAKSGELEDSLSIEVVAK